MSIWGSKRVSSLRFSSLHVLPSFKVCLQCNHHLVAHEVVLSLQRLVKKFGSEQEIITWDIIMDIVESLLHMIDVSYFVSQWANRQKNSLKECVFVNSKYSAILSKIHSYRLRFCPLGW